MMRENNQVATKSERKTREEKKYEVKKKVKGEYLFYSLFQIDKEILSICIKCNRCLSFGFRFDEIQKRFILDSKHLID